MKTPSKVKSASNIVALAGLLFGFDTAVISGVDQSLQELWQSSDAFHGWVVISMALWGTLLGALLGGIPTDRFGRKNTLIAVGLLFLISALGSALANNPFVFAFFRFIGGIGVGISTIAAPAYITEISPSNQRGNLVARYQLSIVLGILLALFSNYILNETSQAWRWMLGVEALPALVYSILVFFIPKSPAWLRENGFILLAEESQKTLGIKTLTESFKSNQKSKTKDYRKYAPAFMAVILIALFNQLSGINAVLYYAPRIFSEAGLDQSDAFLSSIGIGAVNLIFTLIGMRLIDRWGRKKLMYLGSIGYIISLSVLSIAYHYQWDGAWVVYFIFFFIASHALGQGTVIWVFIAELFPTHLRAKGQALGSSVHWALAALIPALIPSLINLMGASGVFTFFALMMVLQLIWVYLKMPETKGREVV